MPPLWGPDSFNTGAGMARIETAAAFVQAKMPLNTPGTLSPQDAFDLAAYFTAQARPAFRAPPRRKRGALPEKRQRASWHLAGRVASRIPVTLA